MGAGNSNRIVAVILIGAGLSWLALRQFGWPFSGSLWPLIVIVPGIVLFALAGTFGKGAKALTVIGAVVTGSGLILLGQEMTDYYQSWAYLWTLLPIFAGLALLFVGARDADAQATGAGRGLVLSGAVMFVVFGVVFEGLIFHGGLINDNVVVPLVLIVLGAFLLFRTGGGRGGRMGAGEGDQTPRPEAPAKP